MAASKNSTAGQLSKILSDTFLLYVKTLNYHWNVVDPRFHSLHEFFEEQYEELAEACDTIAERIRAVGSKSPGSMKKFLSLTSLTESEKERSGKEMLQDLLKDHEKMIAELKKEVEIADALNDPGSSDLCVQRLRSHEKSAWMIRSHLEG